MAELSTDNAGVSVRTSNLAPDHPDVGTPNLALGPVDESDLLAEVEVGSLGVVNTVDLDQTGVGVDLALGALVAQVTSLDVESVTVFRRHSDGGSEQQRATQTSRGNDPQKCRSGCRGCRRFVGMRRRSQFARVCSVRLALTRFGTLSELTGHLWSTPARASQIP